MKFHSANRLLRNAEPEALGGGAAAVIPFPAAAAAHVATAPAAEAAAAAAAPVAPVAAVEPSGGQSEATPPSLLEKVTASIQSKGKLLADCNAATVRAETAEAEVLTLRSQLSTLNSQLSTLQAERTGIETALTAALAEKQDVDTAAASQVAALGFEPAALPAASNAPAETRATLAAQIEKETDNNKRWDLTERLEATAN